jgi:hypothetical protein
MTQSTVNLVGHSKVDPGSHSYDLPLGFAKETTSLTLLHVGM